MKEKVFFHGGPLHGLTRTLRGQEVGIEWITDTGPGRQTHARYQRTEERQGESVVYRYEEGGRGSPDYPTWR